MGCIFTQWITANNITFHQNVWTHILVHSGHNLRLHASFFWGDCLKDGLRVDLNMLKTLLVMSSRVFSRLQVAAFASPYFFL